MYYVKQGKQQSEEWVKQARRKYKFTIIIFVFAMFLCHVHRHTVFAEEPGNWANKQASEWMNEWMNEKTAKENFQCWKMFSPNKNILLKLFLRTNINYAIYRIIYFCMEKFISLFLCRRCHYFTTTFWQIKLYNKT